MNDQELYNGNERDQARIRARERILYQRRVRPQQSVQNMWRVYDQSDRHRDFSDEHLAFLRQDPVFSEMLYVRSKTEDGSGDPNRILATKIMLAIRDRSLPGEVYFAILDQIEKSLDELILEQYEKKFLTVS